MTKRRKSPKPTPVSPALAEALVSPVVQPEPVKLRDVIGTESICDKARRMAREREAAYKLQFKANEEQAAMAWKNRRLELIAKRDAVFKRVLGDIAGQDIILKQGHLRRYSICGRTFEWRANIEMFYPIDNTYLSVSLDPFYGWANLEYLGDALIKMDEQETYLREHYPDTFAGRSKLKWHRLVNGLFHGADRYPYVGRSH